MPASGCGHEDGEKEMLPAGKSIETKKRGRVVGTRWRHEGGGARGRGRAATSIFFFFFPFLVGTMPFSYASVHKLGTVCGTDYSFFCLSFFNIHLEKRTCCKIVRPGLT